MNIERTLASHSENVIVDTFIQNTILLYMHQQPSTTLLIFLQSIFQSRNLQITQIQKKKASKFSHIRIELSTFYDRDSIYHLCYFFYMLEYILCRVYVPLKKSLYANMNARTYQLRCKRLSSVST